MCTVSFIARRRGYLLAMNRDEQVTRAKGLPPKMILRGGRKIIFPFEPGGGTWMALNDAGVTFALINWYSVTAAVKNNSVSRGLVVNAVSAQVSPEQAMKILAELPLKKINPFRLIGVFPATQNISEWRWDFQTLVRHHHAWQTRQWISSGLNEPTAQQIRGETFRQMLRQKSAGTLDWLRRVHRSHAPECGPFSTCMHRADAATVSGTEVFISSRRATLRYLAGALCEHPKTFQLQMKVSEHLSSSTHKSTP